jgi:hypothetical protein
MQYPAFFKNDLWASLATQDVWLTPTQQEHFANNKMMEYPLFALMYGTKERMVKYGANVDTVATHYKYLDLGKDIERGVFDRKEEDGRMDTEFTKWLLTAWERLGITPQDEERIPKLGIDTVSYGDEIIGKMTNKTAVDALCAKMGRNVRARNMWAWRGADKRELIKRIDNRKSGGSIVSTAIHNQSINEGDVFCLMASDSRDAKRFVEWWQRLQSTPMHSYTFRNDRDDWNDIKSGSGITSIYPEVNDEDDTAVAQAEKQWEHIVDAIWDTLVADEAQGIRKLPMEYILPHMGMLEKAHPNTAFIRIAETIKQQYERSR